MFKGILGTAFCAVFALYGLAAIGIVPTEHMEHINLNSLRESLLQRHAQTETAVVAKAAQDSNASNRFTDRISENSSDTPNVGESQTTTGRYRLKAAGGGAERGGTTELSSQHLAPPKAVKYIKSL